MTIRTRASVEEMIAPGAEAVLAPVLVGFCIGPRCLMGILVGDIARDCMVAILSSNARDA